MPTGIAIRKSLTVGAVPKSTFWTSVSRSSTSTTPSTTNATCVTKSVRARKNVQAGRLLHADDVQRGEDYDDENPDDVRGGFAELPEHAEVVGTKNARWRP